MQLPPSSAQVSTQLLLALPRYHPGVSAPEQAGSSSNSSRLGNMRRIKPRPLVCRRARGGIMVMTARLGQRACRVASDMCRQSMPMIMSVLRLLKKATTGRLQLPRSVKD